MLNGKFFTGLPPKMIDRRTGAGGVANRQESHFFWPDDTKLESAAEVRVKRRNSLLLEPSERPRLQPQPSLGASEVDTRQRFHKEFARSSIQFCDNIPEEGGLGRPERRQHVIRGGKLVKNEITAKPTATKMPLPESAVDEGFTSNRKKQVFESKIEFYDNEDGAGWPQRNNARKPQLDLNDKKDVERNTKNSPKLQVKHNVRHLSEERMNNDIKEQTPVAHFQSSQDEFVVGPQRVVRNSFIEERTSTRGPPRAGVGRTVRRTNLDYENSVDIPTYRIGRSGGVRLDEGAHLPKRILKQPVRVESPHGHGYEQPYAINDADDVASIESNMRGLRATASPKKHVTYRDEAYQPEEPPTPTPPPSRYYDDENAPPAHKAQPNMRTGSDRRRTAQYADDNAVAVAAEPYQYMETGYKSTRSRDHNIHNNSSNIRNSTNNNNNNSTSHNQLNNRAGKISPKLSAVASPSRGREPATSAVDGADAPKHLRSSLAFNNGEIVADNGGMTTSMTTTAAAGTTTPTANYRRNARSSATSRVSVGLPD